MFKRFLEFLKGDSEEREFEGGYFNDLLERVEPTVVEELELRPQHDPLLVVIAEILRETTEERWEDQELRCPLVDAESPGNEPPPPPGGSGAAPSTMDLTEDIEQVRQDLVDDLVDEEADPSESNDAKETSEDDADSEAETSPDAPSDAAGEATPPTSETDSETTEAEAPSPPSEPSDEASDAPSSDDEAASDETNDESDELEDTHPEGELGYEITSTVEVETPASAPNRANRTADEGPPRLDSEPVMQAGRVFLDILIENDRLPVEMQMSPEDIEQARDLLLGYFLGSEDVGQHARDMLDTVEEKFSEGLYSQAAILLELFESDRTTRIENDRNLFYDEMVLRFGEHRRHGLETGDPEEGRRLVEEARSGDREAEDELFAWLADSYFLSFDVLARNREELERWEEIAAQSSRAEVVEDFTSVVPPERWRLPGEFERPLIELLEAYLSPERLEAYVIDHVKTCYFVLRAMGDTGLEPYLDVFFDWTEAQFGVDAVALMPPLYEEMTANGRLIEAIFGELYDTHFAEPAEALHADWERDDLAAALDRFYDTLAATELDEIRPGHYNLGHFVLDDLLEIEYPDDDFAFNMHRLS